MSQSAPDLSQLKRNKPNIKPAPDHNVDPVVPVYIEPEAPKVAEAPEEKTGRKRKAAIPTVQLNVRIALELRETIERLAEAENVSFSAIIDKAVAAYDKN